MSPFLHRGHAPITNTPSLVNPGMAPSPHLHQIVGGNAFNTTMDPTSHNMATTATYTSCVPTEDFSNY